MNAKMAQLAVLAVVFAVASCAKPYNKDSGELLTCIVCNTIEQEDCPNVKYSQNCTAEQKYCRKIEQEINIGKEDTKRTIHQCATTVDRAPGEECLERTGTYRFKSWYCSCQDHNCNSAGTATVSILLSTVAVFVSLFRNL